jgi:hypothetical protein
MGKAARADLAQIEAATDWQALVDAALAEPPDPGPLYRALKQWELLFRVVEGGEPMEADRPEPVRFFIQRLILAAWPPRVWEWLIEFKRRKGRPASLKEIPKRYRDQIPKSKRGPPRFDTRRYRAARRAWEVVVFRDCYEFNRDMIRFLRYIPDVGGWRSLDKATMLGDRPSALALELVAGDAKISAIHLDRMGVRRRKK